MSDHLPECPHANSRTATFYGGYCVCPLLRACEQRALDAAWEAVEALGPLVDVDKWSGGYDCCGCDTTYLLHNDALAAINALREEQK